MVGVTMINHELRQELTTCIVNAVHPVRIILFGSYAYGEVDEGSDLDLVVVEEKMKSRMEEMRKVRKALVNIPIPKDIIVCDEEYFETHSTQDWVNTALYDARKKGIVLYEKGRD
jgi:predicted nucleotidyltransferase